MTEHTRFPSGLLNCSVRYSETKEIKEYTDSNKYVTGATKGGRLPGRLGNIPFGEGARGAAGTAGTGPGLAGRQQRAGWALAAPLTPGEGWEGSSTDAGRRWPRWISHGNLRRNLPAPRIFPLPLPRLSPTSADFLQLPGREHGAGARGEESCWRCPEGYGAGGFQLEVATGPPVVSGTSQAGDTGDGTMPWV